MGFFLDEQSPVIWRGPIVMGIVRQFLRDVDWGPTDFLVVDLPPGTGDAPLTLVQQVPVTGGVIVTTPQDVALLDVGRGHGDVRAGEHAGPGRGREHGRLRVPRAAARRTRCSARAGAPARRALRRAAARPHSPRARRCARAAIAGVPLVAAAPEHPVARIFRELAERVAEAAERAAVPATAGQPPEY